MQKKSDFRFESVIDYLHHVECECFSGTMADRTLESKLTTVYTLYMAAWAVGEISWNDAFYGYADFTAKLLNIR